MFQQVFDNLKTATEAGVHMQQEMFKKWTGMWPGLPVPPKGTADVGKVQKKWTEFVGEQVKRQRETLEAQFSAGLKNFEESFRLFETKDPQELRTRTIELWQKAFENVRQGYEALMRDFQGAVVKWTELMTKVPAAG